MHSALPPPPHPGVSCDSSGRFSPRAAGPCRVFQVASAGLTLRLSEECVVKHKHHVILGNRVPLGQRASSPPDMGGL